ncbi:unnamed protein product [[Candida] boidinii]|nr:unnamed protein product [[Candida] boidinii]
MNYSLEANNVQLLNQKVSQDDRAKHADSVQRLQEFQFPQQVPQQPQQLPQQHSQQPQQLPQQQQQQQQRMPQQQQPQQQQQQQPQQQFQQQLQQYETPTTSSSTPMNKLLISQILML